jgi:hypothetical protein
MTEMGTRADFYVGKGDAAEWIGSIAWDGYRDGIGDAVLKADTEDAYRLAVAAFFAERDDVTLPGQGWPWPWKDSGTSDCSYWFFDGKVWDAQGYPIDYWAPCNEPEPDTHVENWHDGLDACVFPDMTDKQNVTMGKRSGLIVLGG